MVDFQQPELRRGGYTPHPVAAEKQGSSQETGEGGHAEAQGGPLGAGDKAGEGRSLWRTRRWAKESARHLIQQAGLPWRVFKKAKHDWRYALEESSD